MANAGLNDSRFFLKPLNDPGDSRGERDLDDDTVIDAPVIELSQGHQWISSKDGMKKDSLNSGDAYSGQSI